CLISGIKLREQEALVGRYEALREPMAARKQKLSDSLRLQHRDVDEIEAWISEKLQTASDDEDYGDTLAAVQVTSRSGSARFKSSES
uniref:Uncharacterized protein n=1 Tax=Cyprinodon variegatus TaxID=28743 RepID=A0A3Q2CL53_CYPVA